ncbi:uncharacterized protein LOC111690456 isoform X1 [Lucilia cuprina]|uniref:uncharacterized protein LOC111690456 isoform X1 n=1 Tax=Lucilia cuprina TaxID=7375 RepID=UPI000C7198B1|nr:uncharacterized protein LOC111690456 isoform X1 [Lucilia cuprina]
MNFNKYFAFLAILVLCVLGQQAVEAHHHHLFGNIGHELDKGVKQIEKVTEDVTSVSGDLKTVAGGIEKATKVVEAGSLAGAVAAAAA